MLSTYRRAAWLWFVFMLACVQDPTQPPPPGPVPVATVAVTPEQQDLVIGDTLRLNAVTLAADGRVLPDRVITWTSELPNVAKVSATGVVVAVAEGVATVRASSDGKSGAAVIRVASPPPPPPPTPYIALLRPDSVFAGGPGFTLSVRGTGFVPGAVVRWNHSLRPTTYFNEFELHVAISADDIKYHGNAAVVAVNPGNVVSNARDFRVVLRQYVQSDIIFEGYPAGVEELMFFELPGISPRRVQPGLLVRDPSPSPDGRQIAFVGVDAQLNSDIYVMSRGGTNVRRLTSDPAPDEQPAWSPDGTAIAFRSTRGHLGDIWLINPDGTGERRLTYDPLPGVVDDARPSWSPDSKYVVFSRGGGSQRHLWIVDRLGFNDRQLTNGLERDDHPAWAPDGSAIAFSRTFVAERRTVIAMVTPLGLPITLSEVRGIQPAWSLDSALLTFVMIDASGRSDIGIMVRDGGSAGYLILDAQYRVAGSNPAWIKR